MSNLNFRIRGLLKDAEAARPGLSARSERIAVYSVATGQRLGMDIILLISLRVTAELQDVDVQDPDLLGMIAQDALCLEILALCSEFDSRRFGTGDQPQLSDAECVEWLESEGRKRFREEVVDALLAVQSVIQPIGT